MLKTVIVFGENTLIIPLPQDYAIQQQLVEAKLVFNENGESVISMPDAGLWPESYYCIPFAGLTKLLFAIADVLRSKTACDIEFAFADAVYVGQDAGMRATLFKCLRAVFGEHMPWSFDPANWLASPRAGASLVESSQAQYLEECGITATRNIGIAASLDEYKRNRDPNRSLPDSIAYFCLDTSNAIKFNGARAGLKSRIDGMQEDSTRNIFLNLNILRLQQSVMPLLNALKNKCSADRVVFVTSNDSHRKSAEQARIRTVYTGDIATNIVEGNQEASCLLTSKTMRFLVETILSAVDSPFPVFAAYMSLLKQDPVEFSSRYFGAHFFINHPLFMQEFQRANQYNHVALSEAFRAMSATLVKMDPQAILANDQMQRNIEFLVARFTASLRGKVIDHRVPLATIIPQEIIAAFTDCQTIAADPDILWRTFLMWCSSQLQGFEVGTTGGLIHFARDLKQIASSYTENLELIERVDACMAQLSQVLSEEIRRQQDRNDAREDLVTVADGLLPRTPTRASREQGDFETPRKPPARRTVHFAGEGVDPAVVDLPRSRRGSTSSALNETMPLDELRDLVLTDEELRHLRVETFCVSRDTRVKKFLEERVRLSRHVGWNVSLVYANNDASEAFQVVARDGDLSEEDLQVVAIGYCNPATRETVYYRRAKEESDNKKLRENGPLTNLPILVVKTKLLGDKKEIKVIWGASLTDVYIGKAETTLPTIPDIQLQEIDREVLLGQIYEKISALLVSPRLKPLAHEILTAVHNLDLVRKEGAFLSLDVSDMEREMRQLVDEMRTAYQFINQQRMPGLFSLEVTTTGIKAEIDFRGQKLLSILNLGLNAANAVILLSLIFGFKGSVIPINAGDEFFYLNRLNAQLLRAAILTVYVSTPFEVGKQLIGYLSKFWAQINFSRQLTRLPRDIQKAIAGGSLSRQTIAAKLDYALGMLVGPREVDLPQPIKTFVSALHDFACISEASHQLPPELRLVFVNVGKEMADTIVRGQPSQTISPEQMAIETIQKAEKMYLKVTASVAVVSAVVAAIFSGIYYSLINTRGNDSELSDLTRADLYALGIAALYLLYKFGGSIAEASISYAASRKAGLFGRSGDREAADTSLQHVRIVNDATPASGERVANNSLDATPETPLFASRPRPGRGCNCTIL